MQDVRVEFLSHVDSIPDVAFADIGKFVELWFQLLTELVDLLEALLLDDAALLSRAALNGSVKIELRYT